MSLLSLCMRFWGKSTNLCQSCHVKLVNKFSTIQRSRMPPPMIYRSVETVLNVLQNYKADNLQAVNSLLEIYNKALKNYEENRDSTSKKFPLIILEGLDGSGKSTVGLRLAAKLNAKNWCTPPESIKHIRHLFDDHVHLRTAYYALGNYIAALEVAVILKNQPVIMDRYWYSTAAFALAQAVHDFPEEVKLPSLGDTLYEWPDDLIKPDVVLFLDVREDIRLQRISRRTVNTTQEILLKNSQEFRGNIISIYKNMASPKVVFVNGNGNFNSVLKEIDTQIKHLFI